MTARPPAPPAIPARRVRTVTVVVHAVDENLVRTLRDLVEDARTALDTITMFLPDEGLEDFAAAVGAMGGYIDRLADVERDLMSDLLAARAAEVKVSEDAPLACPAPAAGAGRGATPAVSSELDPGKGTFEYRAFLPPDGMKWEIVRADSLGEAIAKSPAAWGLTRIYKAKEVRAA